MIAPKRKTIAPTSSDTDGRYNHEHIMMILSWCYHVRIRGSLWLDGSSNRSVCIDPLKAHRILIRLLRVIGWTLRMHPKQPSFASYYRISVCSYSIYFNLGYAGKQ
jgi:hypothetical protein